MEVLKTAEAGPRWVPAPLRQHSFRLLWAGMGLSYAGDRLQGLAQGWLVALLTGSALAVAWINIIGSIPMLLIPLGGVIADQVDRRRLMIIGQAAGAVVTTVIGVLVWLEIAQIWHIYAWSLAIGLVWMVMRPAYKVALTAVVPPEQVRQAVGINSITETTAIVLMNALGALLISWAGLPLAFAINAATYMIAIYCLWRLKPVARVETKKMSARLIARDLLDGFRSMRQTSALFRPLWFSFLLILFLTPASSLLPAVVSNRGGTIVHLGLLGAAASLGMLVGAAYAGARSEGTAMRTYAIFGLIGAAALVLFVINPLGPGGVLSMPVIGFLIFAQAVWNTSRVPRLAASEYQARFQALTTMAITIGSSVSAFWGGFAVDRFGLNSLLAGSLMVALISCIVLIREKQEI
jgi:MFS family permease